VTEFKCGEVAAVPDEAIMWRAEKVSDNHIYWSEELDRWVPRLPNALVFNKELSTFWGQHILVSHEGGPADVAFVRKGPAVVFGCTAGQLRDLEVSVFHDPVPEDLPTPPACAHVLSGFPVGLDKAGKKRIQAEIVRIMIHEPGSGVIDLTRPPN
jgi:hypothetical protein